MNKKQNKCCVQKRTGNQSNALIIKRMGKNTELDMKFEKKIMEIINIYYKFFGFIFMLFHFFSRNNFV